MGFFSLESEILWESIHMCVTLGQALKIFFSLIDSERERENVHSAPLVHFTTLQMPKMLMLQQVEPRDSTQLSQGSDGGSVT